MDVKYINPLSDPSVIDSLDKNIIICKYDDANLTVCKYIKEFIKTKYISHNNIRKIAILQIAQSKKRKQFYKTLGQTLCYPCNYYVIDIIWESRQHFIVITLPELITLLRNILKEQGYKIVYERQCNRITHAYKFVVNKRFSVFKKTKHIYMETDMNILTSNNIDENIAQTKFTFLELTAFE
jgi:hypothetical protein